MPAVNTGLILIQLALMPFGLTLPGQSDLPGFEPRPSVLFDGEGEGALVDVGPAEVGQVPVVRRLLGQWRLTPKVLWVGVNNDRSLGSPYGRRSILCNKSNTKSRMDTQTQEYIMSTGVGE